ncbi:MAG: hypothetical protein ACTSYW_00275 [Candidatus Heimdallarchaeota archaeon]
MCDSSFKKRVPYKKGFFNGILDENGYFDGNYDGRRRRGKIEVIEKNAKKMDEWTIEFHRKAMTDLLVKYYDTGDKC